MELYVVESVNHGATWSQPQALAALNDPLTMDMFPFVVQRGPGDFFMVFTNYAGVSNMDYFSASTDLFYAQSSDGLTWNSLAPITRDDDAGHVDSLPSVFETQGGAWDVVWTTTGLAPPGLPKIARLPVTSRSDYPSAASQLGVTSTNGYSIRVVATGTPGLYLAVWVQDHGPSKRLYWHIIAL
jgi:hypothetical protein